MSGRRSTAETWVPFCALVALAPVPPVAPARGTSVSGPGTGAHGTSTAGPPRGAPATRPLPTADERLRQPYAVANGAAKPK
jgi:hypothetical protein